MLAAEHRLTRSADFSGTTRTGLRAGRDRVVVHVRRWPVGEGASATLVGSSLTAVPGRARVGLVVSKSVGNAVVRHRVSRRLRHVCAEFLSALPEGTDVVLRARPAAAGASSSELDADVRSGLRRLGVLAGSR